MSDETEIKLPNTDSAIGAIFDSIDPKPWWESRAIWGSIIASAAIIAAMAGIQVDVASTTELVVGGIGLIGNAIAWYGRVKASRPISTKKVVGGVTRK